MTVDYAIEEFKALRNELMYMTKMIRICEGFFFTAVSASFGFLLSKNTPITILFIILAYIIMIYRYDYSKGVAKVGAYIAVFIEPNIKGLGWENNLTVLQKMKEKNLTPMSTIQKINSEIKKYMFNAIIFVLSTYCFFIEIDFSINTIIKMLLLIVINILTVLNAFDMAKNFYPREHYLKVWSEIQKITHDKQI